MGFLRQEYWSGLPLPSLGYLPNPRIEPVVYPLVLINMNLPLDFSKVDHLNRTQTPVDSQVVKLIGIPSAT